MAAADMPDFLTLYASSQPGKLAVIDGQVVPLGGAVGEARVVRITETEVLLKTGEETETLKLYPGVDKQAVKRGARSASASTPARGSATQGGAK